MHRFIAALAAAALLAGCSMGQDMSTVQAGITAFHQQMNAQAFDKIYQASSADMKGASDQAGLVKLLSAVHRKLGDFQSGSAVGWNDNVATGGHFVTVHYAANYALGKADETFTYRVDGSTATLAGYHINSLALIEN